MDSKIRDYFWKNPSRFILRLFLLVVAFCVLFTFMPKRFNMVVAILILGVGIILFIRWEIKEIKRQRKEEKEGVLK